MSRLQGYIIILLILLIAFIHLYYFVNALALKEQVGDFIQANESKIRLLSQRVESSKFDDLTLKGAMQRILTTNDMLLEYIKIIAAQNNRLLGLISER